MGFPTAARMPALSRRGAAAIALVAWGLLLRSSPLQAQYKGRFSLDKPEVAPPLLRAVRLGGSVAPTWAECSGTKSACSRLDNRGAGLRLEAMAPLNDGVALGGRLTHARFGGTPSTSHVSLVELAAQVHSNFDGAAGVYFGISYPMMTSPGEAGCSGKPSAGFGAEFGVRVRARDLAAAIGSPFRSCVVSSAYSLEPQSGDPAAIGGIGIVGLALNFDVGKYRD
jgi:hypothetical protein